MSENQLTTLPAEIGQLLQLEGLDLSANQLSTLPVEIGQLLQLHELHLSSNQLTTLPAEIGQLLQLQELHLNSNRLTTLPAEIGQLLQLQDLYLYSNQLATLPAEIGQLQQLQSLNLSLNRLTTLPAEIGQLLQLEWLSLSKNPALSEIPIAFCNMLNITYLDIIETSIPSAQGDLVLATIRRQRDLVAVERLAPKLVLWKGYAQMPDLDLNILIQAESENLNSSKFNRIEPNTLEIVSNSRC